MPSPFRFALAAALAFACQAAVAQTAVPPTLTVQRLAPHLVAFAGSPSNFQSLVNGLAQGTPIQLVTLLPDGFTQVVTFTPSAAMSPTDIARVLETTRQQLIGLGIGNPTSEQIAFTLMGGTVPTALGGTQVAGVLNAQKPPSPAAQTQGAAAAGATTPPPAAAAPPATIPAVTNTVNVQLFPSTAPPATSVTPTPRSTSDSLAPAGATSRSPAAAGATSASPAPTTPTPAPGADAGSTPGAGQRAPAGGTPPGAQR